MKWICCQLGAREHYAVPRALQLTGVLDEFITDVWNRFTGRFHPSLESARVTAPNAAALTFELKAYVTRANGWKLIGERNEWFQQRALEKLQKQPVNGPRTVFAYSYAAEGIFEFARERGWRTVLGQIDLGPADERIVAQVVGGIIGAGVLYLIASGKADFELARFAANGYGIHSPGGYSLAAGLITEVVMTFMFLLIILNTTHKRAPVGFAGLVIGFALTLIHLISIPVTATSVNPARSTATALFVGGWAIQQLWLFWVAPVIGAALAGVTHTLVLEGPAEEPPVTGRARS